MKLREKIKRFWTLDVHNHEGFTLVELIIVIAILAILSSVAVVGYSSYVEKANKQADQTLVAEIMNALTLAYYDGTITEAGYVILSFDAVPEVSDATFAAAMAAAYGDNWNAEGNKSLCLQYAGWNGSYGDSSFAGAEGELLNQVEQLTEALAKSLEKNPELLDGNNGAGFKEYMKTVLGFSDEDLKDEAKVADAAVLYVANGANSVDQNSYNTVIQNVTKGNSAVDAIGPMITGFKAVYGSNVQGAAATYALLVGFARYMGEKNIPEMPVMPEGFDPNNVGQMVGLVYAPFAEFEWMEDEAKWQEYCEKRAQTDGVAYTEALRTANSAKDQVVADLGKTNCFISNETLSKLFNAYGDGHIVVLLEIKNDILEVYPLPEMD